jgi:hypothetical protein
MIFFTICGPLANNIRDGEESFQPSETTASHKLPCSEAQAAAEAEAGAEAEAEIESQALQNAVVVEALQADRAARLRCLTLMPLLLRAA